MTQDNQRQPDQLMSQTIEMQQNAIERSQQALEDAVEIPIRQTLQFQKSAGELFLTGLEIGNWMQSRSSQLTRDALGAYLETVDDASRDAARMTNRNIEAVGELGQQELESRQQQLAAGAGRGGTPDTVETQTRQPPQLNQQPTGQRSQSSQPSGFQPSPQQSQQQNQEPLQSQSPPLVSGHPTQPPPQSQSPPATTPPQPPQVQRSNGEISGWSTGEQGPYGPSQGTDVQITPPQPPVQGFQSGPPQPPAQDFQSGPPQPPAQDFQPRRQQPPGQGR